MPNANYTFKFAVKKYSNETTNICWGSLETYLNAPEKFGDILTSSCDRWEDPETPSFVIQMYAESSFYFHYDYTPRKTTDYKYQYAILDLGATFVNSTEEYNPKMISGGVVASRP